MVGGGRMGLALTKGLLEGGWASPGQVAVVEVSPGRRAELTDDAGPASGLHGLHGLQVVGTVAEAGPARGAVMAVKPADMEAACRALDGSGVTRVLSIAAGVTLGAVESYCPHGCAVVRAMPNIAAVVNAGATAISPGTNAGAEDVEWAAGIMRSVGLVVEVPETLLDAVTGLSGSGPAYVFLLAEAMTEAGVHEGLPRPLARDLVAQTLLGAAQLLLGTGQSPEELRAAVTSPGGTTAAGLRRLESGGARSAVIEAVVAAAARSRELGALPRAGPGRA